MNTADHFTPPDAYALDNVPQSLRSLPQWVVWRLEDRRDRKTKKTRKTKVPYYLTEDGVIALAATNDPATWMTFSKARKLFEDPDNNLSGIGFVLTAADSFVGFDFDDCLHDGRIIGPAAEWVRRLHSYTEVSPSRRGIRIFVLGKLLPDRGKKGTADGPDADGVVKPFKVETYEDVRFLTVTGWRWPGTSDEVVWRTAEVDECHRALFREQRKRKKGDQRPVQPVDLDDQSLLKLAKAARNGRSFTSLYGGSTAGHDNDSSGADLALCNMLAFWTGRDASRMDRLFRASGLMRDKWDEKHSADGSTYGQMTIDRAIGGTDDVYDPKGTTVTTKSKPKSKPSPEPEAARPHTGAPTPPQDPSPDAHDDDRDEGDDAGEVGDDDRGTELANAEEVARHHGRDVRYNVDSGRFLHYDGRCWPDDLTGQVTRYVKRVAKASVDRLGGQLAPRELDKFRNRVESAAGVNGVLSLLRTELGITVASAQLDADDDLLPCANGVVDLRDGTLHAHRREYLFTRCLPTAYVPDAPAPIWTAFLDRIMGGNATMVGYLQRLCGVWLTGTGTLHELPIFYGVGANGKSVFVDTILGLLGPYGGVAPDSLLVVRNGASEHPTELADLKGKRLVVASETEAGATLRLQLVKRLTGDATIKARFMRQDYFEFRRTHKLVLVTNNRPRLTENTEAVWRRLRIIPFTVVIPPAERDLQLIDKLRDEYAGILAWAVRGCLDWRRGGMRPPKEILVATDEYRAEADELAEFVAARCITGGTDLFRATRSELHAEYLGWAKLANERRPMERAAFYEAVRRRDGVTEGEWKVGGQKVRGFHGIGIVKVTAKSTGGSAAEREESTVDDEVPSF